MSIVNRLATAISTTGTTQKTNNATVILGAAGGIVDGLGATAVGVSVVGCVSSALFVSSSFSPSVPSIVSVTLSFVSSVGGAPFSLSFAAMVSQGPGICAVARRQETKRFDQNSEFGV